jgi:hypothetical protein
MSRGLSRGMATPPFSESQRHHGELTIHFI